MPQRICALGPFAVYSSQVATSRCAFVDNRAARALTAGSLEARRISAARTAGIVRSVGHAARGLASSFALRLQRISSAARELSEAIVEQVGEDQTDRVRSAPTEAHKAIRSAWNSGPAATFSTRQTPMPRTQAYRASVSTRLPGHCRRSPGPHSRCR